MASIKYTSIINAYVSTEGSNGFMTNYIYYSVLVVYDNGAREIVEGRNHDIARLLPFLRTPVDELSEVKATVKQLRQEINEITDQKVGYIIDSMFPIPDLANLNETEAARRIEAAGLKPAYIHQYPEGTPANGVVRAFGRNSANFKYVDLDIFHEMPEVTGLARAQAEALLKNAGFIVQTKYTMLTNHENCVVLSCKRESDTSMNVQLDVAVSIPETKGMQLEEAQTLLQQNGFETIVETLFSNDPANVVKKWESAGERTVRLWISLDMEIPCKNIDIKWASVPESSGDHYSASAVFNRFGKTVRLNIGYVIGGKTKYKISAVRGTPAKGFRPLTSNMYDGMVIEPGVRGELSFTIYPESAETISAPMDNISLTLEAQYGIMKKTISIPLELKLEW